MDKWRYHPGVEALAGIVRSGELGEVTAIETVRIGFGRPHDDADGIWILAPHDLSIILHVLGTLPPAYAARADCVGGVAAGMVGLLGGSPWASVEVHTRSTHRIRRVTLRCSDGVATLDGADDDRVAVLRGYPIGDRPPEPEQRPVATELPLLAELRAFVGHLHGGAPPMSSAAEAAEICRRIAELRALAGIGK
jgi:predicted dehydrogenase